MLITVDESQFFDSNDENKMSDNFSDEDNASMREALSLGSFAGHRFVDITHFEPVNLLHRYNEKPDWWNPADKHGREYLRSNCDDLDVWDERDGLTDIRIVNCEVIPRLAFQFCYNLRVVIMSDCVERIDDFAFQNCLNLEYVRLSKNITYIGERAFEGCLKLQSLIIPDICKMIDQFAFRNCRSITMLRIPEISNPENYLFDDCNKLLQRININDACPSKMNLSINKFCWSRFDELALHQVCSSQTPRAFDIFNMLEKLGPRIGLETDYQGMTALHILMTNAHITCHDTTALAIYLRLCPEAGVVNDKYGQTPLDYLIQKAVGHSISMVNTYYDYCPAIKMAVTDYSDLISTACTCSCHVPRDVLQLITEIFSKYLPDLDKLGPEFVVGSYLEVCPECDTPEDDI